MDTRVKVGYCSKIFLYRVSNGKHKYAKPEDPVVRAEGYPPQV